MSGEKIEKKIFKQRLCLSQLIKLSSSEAATKSGFKELQAHVCLNTLSLTH